MTLTALLIIARVLCGAVVLLGGIHMVTGNTSAFFPVMIAMGLLTVASVLEDENGA